MAYLVAVRKHLASQAHLGDSVPETILVVGCFQRQAPSAQMNLAFAILAGAASVTVQSWQTGVQAFVDLERMGHQVVAQVRGKVALLILDFDDRSSLLRPVPSLHA